MGYYFYTSYNERYTYIKGEQMETQDNLGYYITAVFVGTLASYLIGHRIERWASKRFLPSLEK